MSGRARTHLEAATTGPLTRGYCGWLDVLVKSDISMVTCKKCLELLRANRAAATSEYRRRPALAEVAQELASALKVAPCAERTAGAALMGKRKQYTVVADVTISLHQTVWATSKEQALRIAQGLDMPTIHEDAKWHRDGQQPKTWDTSGELDGEAMNIHVEDE